mmetsp:Transcript_11571/g.25446  ORF Transcript_11571/g.25446 Transcript_11571/m.25446 type:complete len:378 (-) Transcript_11571:269-1402(-)
MGGTDAGHSGGAREVKLQGKAKNKGSSCPYDKGQTARLSQGKVNYRLEGPAGAPIVVCLHGLNANLSSFMYLGPLLVEEGFRVLTFDFYGFGLSSSPLGKRDASFYAKQLLDLLDFIWQQENDPPTAMPPVHIVGYCLGGLVATEFALQYPQRIARLLLVAPCGFVSRKQAPCQPLLFGCLRQPCRGAFFLGLVSCLAWCCQCPVRFYLRGKELDAMSPDVRDPDSEFCKAAARRNTNRYAWSFPRSLISCLRGLRDMPIWREDFHETYARLAETKVPVLFLWGDDDGVVALDEAREALTSLFAPKQRSCIVLEGAGHGLIGDSEDVPEVASCAASWFRDAQSPSWLKRLRGSRIGAEANEENNPSSFVERVLNNIL